MNYYCCCNCRKFYYNKKEGKCWILCLRNKLRGCLMLWNGSLIKKEPKEFLKFVCLQFYKISVKICLFTILQNFGQNLIVYSLTKFVCSQLFKNFAQRFYLKKMSKFYAKNVCLQISKILRKISLCTKIRFVYNLIKFVCLQKFL